MFITIGKLITVLDAVSHVSEESYFSINYYAFAIVADGDVLLKAVHSNASYNGYDGIFEQMQGWSAKSDPKSVLSRSQKPILIDEIAAVLTQCNEEIFKGSVDNSLPSYAVVCRVYPRGSYEFLYIKEKLSEDKDEANEATVILEGPSSDLEFLNIIAQSVLFKVRYHFAEGEQDVR